jgi:hypothetical protein
MIRKLLIWPSWLLLLLVTAAALAFSLGSWVAPRLQAGVVHFVHGRGLLFHILFVLVLYAAVSPAAYNANRLWLDENEATRHERLAAMMNILFFPIFLLSTFGLAVLTMLDMKLAADTTSYTSPVFYITCVLPNIILTLIFLGSFAVFASVIPPIILLLMFGPLGVAYWIILHSA